jgi:hypothetical protein
VGSGGDSRSQKQGHRGWGAGKRSSVTECATACRKIRNRCATVPSSEMPLRGRRQGSFERQDEEIIRIEVVACVREGSGKTEVLRDKRLRRHCR